MENYGPYQEPFVLECESNSLTLITGPNGIGKTIALDSLAFTFYGLTGKGERGDEVVNNTSGKNCHTWVKFEDEESGDSYVVDRYHQHTKYRNTVHITRNDDDKPYKVGHREVTSEIDKLICDRKTFNNTLMFGQKVKDFFTDLPDGDQKAIFWKILDLMKYGYYQKSGKGLLDTEKAKIDTAEKATGIALGIIENAEEQIKTEVEKSKTYEMEQAASVKSKAEEIATSEKELMVNNKLLANMKEEDSKEIQEKIFSLKAKISNIGNDAAAIKKSVEDEAYAKANELTASCAEKKREITQAHLMKAQVINIKQTELVAKYNIDAAALAAKRATLNAQASEKKAYIQSNNARKQELESTDIEVGCVCPTCLEPITDKSINHIETIIIDLIDKIKVLFVDVGNINTVMDQIDSRKAELAIKHTTNIQSVDKEKSYITSSENKELQEVDNRLKELKQQVADMANASLKEQIADLEKSSIKMSNELGKAEIEYTEKEQKIQNRNILKTLIDNLKTQIDNQNKQLKILKETPFDESTLKSLKINKHKQLEIIQRNKEKTKETVEEIKRLEFWIEAYSPKGIPSMLIDQATPLMNTSMKKYLDLLSNGRYIVTFDTISQTKGGEYRDKFSVNVLDTKTQVRDRKQLSGGQTRLIDIATILTLRDLKRDLGEIDFNLFIFDEIFDALDDENIGYVCNILNSLKQDRSLFVVAHRHQDELEADNHIQLN